MVANDGGGFFWVPRAMSQRAHVRTLHRGALVAASKSLKLYCFRHNAIGHSTPRLRVRQRLVGM